MKNRTEQQRLHARRIDFAAVNSAAKPRIAEIVARITPHGRRSGTQHNGCEWVALNPHRADDTPGSFSINLNSGRWADFAADVRGGDVIGYAAYVWGVTPVIAARRIAYDLGVQS
jgi:hypothetical protein